MKVGLIVGLAFRAGVFYYDQIVRKIVERDITPEIMLNHADAGKVLKLVGERDKDKLGVYLGTLANELFAGGAELVAITAVAPHVAIEEIQRVALGPIVDVLGVVADGIAAAGLDRVAVFGNRAVIETDIFGAVPQTAVVRLSPGDVDRVHATYSDIALQGKCGTQPETDLLRAVARGLVDGRGTQAIVLAGTDLSSFYADTVPDYPFLDVARRHVDEIVRRAVSL